MLFDHDQEEEEELEALDALQQQKTREGSSSNQPTIPAGLGRLGGTHTTGPSSHSHQEYSSSSDDGEKEDEEIIRTDIIKYKKKLHKAQEKAIIKEQKDLERRNKREDQKDWRRAFNRSNGFLANRDLPESRKQY